MTPENREYFKRSRQASGVPPKIKSREALIEAAAILRAATKKAGAR